MKLSQASLSIRKAAAVKGITDADAIVTTAPFDPTTKGTMDEVAVIIDGTPILAIDVEYAGSRPWTELKRK